MKILRKLKMKDLEEIRKKKVQLYINDHKIDEIKIENLIIIIVYKFYNHYMRDFL